MQEKFLKLPKYLTPEPGFKSTKHHLKETMSKKILKFSQAVYNKSLSPTYIDMLEKLKLRDESFDFEEKYSNPKVVKKNQFTRNRKMGMDGVKILNLPRLPYGKHLNYDEVGFSRKHFVENLQDNGQEEVRNYCKQMRMQEKIKRKNRKIGGLENSFRGSKRDLMVFHTDAGVLNCLKYEPIIKSYDQEKSKFKFVATFRDVEEKHKHTKSKLLHLKKHQISVDDIEKILRPEYKVDYLKKSLMFD